MLISGKSVHTAVMGAPNCSSLLLGAEQHDDLCVEMFRQLGITSQHVLLTVFMFQPE